MHQKKKIGIAVLVVLFFCTAGVWYLLWGRERMSDVTTGKNEVDSVFAALTQAPEVSTAEDGTLPEEKETKEQDGKEYVNVTDNRLKEETPQMIFVYVCGAVLHPGVYELPEGSRLYEAIALAGGCLPEADEAYHNLAREVFDGERIYVLSKEESNTLSLKERVDGEQVTSGNAGTGPAVSAVGTVNLNTATVEELTSLPGIGESRAEDIIAYRNKVGKFLAIEEIMNISGIGEAMFGRIKDKITVE